MSCSISAYRTVYQNGLHHIGYCHILGDLTGPAEHIWSPLVTDLSRSERELWASARIWEAGGCTERLSAPRSTANQILS